ncbi:cysteine dioxygenase family protein [Cupriavidus basilensis]|uniref:cysteine dioxygenase family protein n=1 Tax=Cupriavidus basilensis TaxID=68895 RepID=UPI00283EDD97|nr:cysteine dioxygenase family protein [Cupriavidus basilensis]MDR3381076.1 cysteine dioxygenase family protein [Cupriavidus basilensis]
MTTQTNQTNPTDQHSQRNAAIAATLAEVSALTAQREVDRATLGQVTAALQKLADQKDLFGFADFPPPSDGTATSTRYRLSGEGQLPALYLNSIVPGKKTIPHNHDTWAVIVAVQGDELNRVYRRTDDGSNPERASIELERELVVRPGTPISFLPQDIHSIHVVGDAPTLHFHLYGRPLETLTGRIGVELESGRIVNYNATQMNRSEKAAA